MRYGAPRPRDRRFRRLRTWWHARRRRRAIAAKWSRRGLLFWYDLEERLRSRRQSLGAASIDPVLLAVLEDSGLTKARIRRLWRGVVLRDRSDMVIVERIARGRVHVDRHSSHMSACLPLVPGVHWIDGELRFSQRGATIPETIVDLLPGRPVREVVDHPAITKHLTFVRRLEDYETSYYKYTVLGHSRRIADPHAGMAIETNSVAVPLPRTSLRAFGHWAWRMRRTWRDARKDLPGREAIRTMAKVNMWGAVISSAALFMLAWLMTHDLRASIMQIPSALLGSVIGGTGGLAIFTAYLLWKRPSRWQMWEDHEEWLTEELERQLF